MKANTLKIALLINSFNLGGAEKLVYDLAFTLKNRGLDIIVISMASIVTQLENNNRNKLQGKGIKVYSINKPCGRKKIKAIIKIYKYIKENKIDILHTHGQSPDFYGRIACAFYRKCKTIVTIHSTSGYSAKIERILLPYTHNYSAVSIEAQEYFRGFGIKKEIEVIPNGIEVSRYKSVHQTMSGNIDHILSVGRIQEPKGYAQAIPEMNKFLLSHPNAVWTIVGDYDSDSGYYNQLINLIDKRIRERIIFTGTIANTEEYYKNADCFLLNSKYEGFGIVFIEAMAAKLPVVCTNVGIIPEILKKGGSFLLIENNAIEYCLNHTENISEYDLENNYQIVSEYYSIESAADQYIHLYEKCISNR